MQTEQTSTSPVTFFLLCISQTENLIKCTTGTRRISKLIMAPVRPGSKAKTAVKTKSHPAIAKAKPTSSFNESATSEFPSSKKDKRLIKHSSFVSKIEKSRKKTLKRRRPSKKLIANLDSLASALPDAGDGDEAVSTHIIDGNTQVNVIRHKSLKHRPGAMKRKEKLDRMERDRFAKNMGQLAAGITTTDTDAAMDVQPSVERGGDASSTTAGGGSNSTSARWAALRSFISQTMDQNPEFKDVKS
ncbi:hypothetical protein MGYG_02598 [Nannizzia gypsea CBS 118893]|uniref:Ribosome biogenesis protein SLX9 n=1 Tax=Arthroderma gypseum (strain ATCC MYA-4604 / CBS 118893) TaxID=535722 RepID=E4UNH8_ARTGP|nr:hypothetical protein MGYG_02598 [Nannizzia gypsea CBS 118893]EFQ99586.1 hypothetical protein MGYG_02598 [Nannizzia gypsea CBS 118893]